MGQLHSCLVGKGLGGDGCLLVYYLKVDIDTHIFNGQEASLYSQVLCYQVFKTYARSMKGGTLI